MVQEHTTCLRMEGGSCCCTFVEAPCLLTRLTQGTPAPCARIDSGSTSLLFGARLTITRSRMAVLASLTSSRSCALIVILRLYGLGGGRALDGAQLSCSCE